MINRLARNGKRCAKRSLDARINKYADRIMHMEDDRLTAYEEGTE